MAISNKHWMKRTNTRSIEIHSVLEEKLKLMTCIFVDYLYKEQIWQDMWENTAMFAPVFLN